MTDEVKALIEAVRALGLPTTESMEALDPVNAPGTRRFTHTVTTGMVCSVNAALTAVEKGGTVVEWVPGNRAWPTLPGEEASALVLRPAVLRAWKSPSGRWWWSVGGSDCEEAPTLEAAKAAAMAAIGVKS